MVEITEIPTNTSTEMSKDQITTKLTMVASISVASKLLMECSNKEMIVPSNYTSGSFELLLCQAILTELKL